MTSGTALATLGLLWLTRLDSGSGYAADVLPSQILASVGVGLFYLAGPNVALSDIEPGDAGVASAALNTSQQIGAALGPALLSTLYASTVTGHLASRGTAAEDAPRAVLLEGYLRGYRIAFIGAAILFALAFAALALLVKKRTAAGSATADSQPVHHAI